MESSHIPTTRISSMATRVWTSGVGNPVSTASMHVGLTVEYGRMSLRDDGSWDRTDDVVVTLGRHSPWDMPAMYLSMYKRANVLHVHHNEHVVCLADRGPPFDALDWSELYVLDIERCPLFRSLPPWTRFTALHTLQLVGTGLLPAAFESIDSLLSLCELELEGANIQVLPDTVCRVHSLRKLKTGGMRLPAALNDLVNLESLTVADNGEFGALPALPALSKLRELDVRHSHAHTIPVLPGLHILAIDLRKMDFACFVDVLPGFTELREIVTHGTIFYDQTPLEGEALVRALHAWPLAHLRLPQQYYVFGNLHKPLSDMPADSDDWDDCKYLTHFNELRACMVAFLGGGHTRLGSGSLLGLLTTETLRDVSLLVQDAAGAAASLAAARAEAADLLAVAAAAPATPQYE